MNAEIERLDREIAEAEAAEQEVQSWHRVVAKAQGLPGLRNQRRALADQLEREAKLRAFAETLRPVLAEAAEKNAQWRERFIDLSGKVEATKEIDQLAGNTKASAVACAAVDKHIAILTGIHAPVLRAQSELILTGQGLQFTLGDVGKIFKEIGGTDARLSLRFGDEVASAYQVQLSSILQSMRVFYVSA